MKRLNFGRPLVLTAALVGAMTLTAKSQETNLTPATPSLSLDALVAEALKKNPELKFYDAELVAAKAGRKTAGVFPNPELNASFGHKTIQSGGDGVAWSASVMQPFEWPGRIGLRKAIANRDVELAELGLMRFRTALANRIRLLTYTLFSAQEKAAVAREVADRFHGLSEVLVQRDSAGITPELEVRVIEATELTMQKKASEAELAKQSALLELNQLRGQPPETELTIVPPQIAFAAPETNTLWLTQARTNNFELRVRAIELKQQGFRVDLAKNERHPTISVGPSISEERAGSPERIVGVGVSLPLPLWNRNTGNIDAAKARQVQAQVSYDVTQREIERKVLEAAATYRTKLAEMSKWHPNAVEKFRSAAELADRHYRLGAVPISTYLELQKQYLEAVESLLDTKKDALDAAQTLKLLTGSNESLAETKLNQEKKND